ncbi:hypothetical protein [Amycolatopsis keratiniphila]|uniref:Uncharacterized protein n=1 Tax=Amycolatopsis keratiniphila subsp. keratiniphila TaxID=227715 RepID=A0A1W2M236_9PSEU|nr:hypothetical protein [Amycolatopsis keratiniphila]ONF73967.1 hypothetical protein AVR91_0204350 [Amycolatopsis keratiniphila subsp. keratiniphila]
MPQPEIRPSADALVGKYWPLPPDRDSVPSALGTAAELARFTNHAVLNSGAVAVPQTTDVQDVAYRLYELAGRLPQLAQMLSGRLAKISATDPTLYAHTGDASTHTAAAGADFARAAALAEDLAAAFNSAFETLAKVSHRDVSEQD